MGTETLSSTSRHYHFVLMQGCSLSGFERAVLSGGIPSGRHLEGRSMIGLGGVPRDKPACKPTKGPIKTTAALKKAHMHGPSM